MSNSINLDETAHWAVSSGLCCLQKSIIKACGSERVNSFDIFRISAQNIDFRYLLEPHRQGGSNEYPQPMFLSRNKKNNVYPCKPKFYYIKVGFKGVKII